MRTLPVILATNCTEVGGQSFLPALQPIYLGRNESTLNVFLSFSRNKLALPTNPAKPYSTPHQAISCTRYLTHTHTSRPLYHHPTPERKPRAKKKACSFPGSNRGPCRIRFCSSCERHVITTTPNEQFFCVKYSEHFRNTNQYICSICSCPEMKAWKTIHCWLNSCARHYTN